MPERVARRLDLSSSGSSMPGNLVIVNIVAVVGDEGLAGFGWAQGGDAAERFEESFAGFVAELSDFRPVGGFGAEFGDDLCWRRR